ncbi:MAG: Kae1-associated serine/threonine protein kinase [Candidatus Methanosuratus sp.]|nr:Kae1-associated serine/threonine protein kinase [Candidatus Methanosuratincola sp.]
MAEMRLLKKGAEAELYLTEWMGLEAILKRRVKKGYRNPDLDLHIRGTRTSNEAKLLSEARRLGVPTPIVYSVDKRDCEILMSYIDAPPLKMLVGGMGSADLARTFLRVGEMVGRLHKGGIVHGDLTTSNIIPYSGLLYLIDFGLGEHTSDVESRGVDIHLMRRALESSHHEVSSAAYLSFIEGYQYIMGSLSELVLRRVDAIRRRGRYVDVSQRKEG